MLMTVEDPLLSPKEAAVLMRMHEEYVRQLVRTGKLRGSQARPHTRMMIRRSEAMHYLEQNHRKRN